MSKTLTKEEEGELVFVKFPSKLRNQVEALLQRGQIESPNDENVLRITLTRPEELTKAGIKWLELLVDRKGKRYIHEGNSKNP